MKTALYAIVELIAYIHDRILMLNDGFPAVLSDKQLHFVVVGVFGMLLFFAVHALFRTLAQSGHLAVVSWIYVFTVIVVITFAIEIGQHISHTGTLEFADIVFGIGGFLVFFAICAAVRGIMLLLARLLGLRGKKSGNRQTADHA